MESDRKQKLIIVALLFVIAIETGFILWQNLFFSTLSSTLAQIVYDQPAATTAVLGDTFRYTFNSDGTLPEAGTLEESWSPYWWLNSGGLLYIRNGKGTTVSGELSRLSPWRLLYNRNNPTDTDKGTHPQNIFRLLSRSTWQNVRTQAYFKILADNLSSSPNRNASNGLLLMTRYVDENNLYYLGIRVDGAAVIKKKVNGDYYTLAYEKIFGNTEYDHSSNPSLLPKNKEIGLRSEVKNNADGTVSLQLFMDEGRTGKWTSILTAIDDGTTYGGDAITGKGHVGIRTDFMDVEFSNFSAEKI